MLDKEDISTAKEIAKVLRESKVDELVVAGNLITVLLAEREQQRTWVGLTEDEMKLIDPDGYADGLPQQIQQALKEKNA
jgi:Icc-related predicted phosphoesterase